MKAKSFSIWLLVFVMAAVSAACQGAPSGASPTADSPAAQVDAVHKTQAAPALAETAAPAEQPSGGSGAFSLDDFSIGLEPLTSYQQALVLGFDGTLAGTETHNKTSLRRTVIRQPAAQITWMEIDGNTQMYATVGDVSYQQSGADGTCYASPAGAQAVDAPPVFQLQSLPAVTGANAAGEESVNGVLSTHYTFDESAIGRAGEVKAKGDLWIAKEGGYIVKYALVIEGEGDQLGPGVAGTQTWAYDLISANAVSEPGLSAGCAVVQAQDLAPLPPDAQDIRRLPNFFQFSAALTPDQAAQFYRDQAAGLQWEEIPGQPMPDADQFLNFKTVAGGLVGIRLHPQGDGTRVTIQTLPGKP